MEPLTTVPFEESRSVISYLKDGEVEETMERCLVEMPASLMASVLPRTILPIRITDPCWNSRVSPSRGPFSMISFKVVDSSSIGKEGRFEFLFFIFEMEEV